ncbi:UNVERIFIED_CONTAM: hypothetical protein K2H54_026179, partial [Gekko kuhli]
MAPALSALPGGLTPAVLDAFWDTPVSRAILDRLAGIERRLEGSAASSQLDVSSFELFQAEVLHRLDTIETRSASASTSAAPVVTVDSCVVQRDVAVAEGQGSAVEEVSAAVSGQAAGRPMATQTCDITWPWGPVGTPAPSMTRGSSVGEVSGPGAVSTPVSAGSGTAVSAQSAAVAEPAGSVVRPLDGTGELVPR